MVVERTCPLMETSSVPRVPKSEVMEVEMMAKTHDKAYSEKFRMK